MWGHSICGLYMGVYIQIGLLKKAPYGSEIVEVRGGWDCVGDVGVMVCWKISDGVGIRAVRSWTER